MKWLRLKGHEVYQHSNRKKQYEQAREMLKKTHILTLQIRAFIDLTVSAKTIRTN